MEELLREKSTEEDEDEDDEQEEDEEEEKVKLSAEELAVYRGNLPHQKDEYGSFPQRRN